MITLLLSLTMLVSVSAFLLYRIFKSIQSMSTDETRKYYSITKIINLLIIQYFIIFITSIFWYLSLVRLFPIISYAMYGYIFCVITAIYVFMNLLNKTKTVPWGIVWWIRIGLLNITIILIHLYLYGDTFLGSGSLSSGFNIYTLFVSGNTYGIPYPGFAWV